MEYTDSQKQEFKRRFARKRRNRFLVLVLLGGIILIRGLGVGPFPFDLFGRSFDAVDVLIILALVIGLGFSIYNWRCPACGRSLGRSSPGMKYLPEVRD